MRHQTPMTTSITQSQELRDRNHVQQTPARFHLDPMPVSCDTPPPGDRTPLAIDAQKSEGW